MPHFACPYELKKHIQHCESAGNIVTIVPSRLSLYPSHLYLNASGDGWVYQDDNCVCMLEVRCPFPLDEYVTTVHPVTLADYPNFIFKSMQDCVR